VSHNSRNGTYKGHPKGFVAQPQVTSRDGHAVKPVTAMRYRDSYRYGYYVLRFALKTCEHQCVSRYCFKPGFSSFSLWHSIIFAWTIRNVPYKNEEHRFFMTNVLSELALMLLYGLTLLLAAASHRRTLLKKFYSFWNVSWLEVHNIRHTVARVISHWKLNLNFVLRSARKRLYLLQYRLNTGVNAIHVIFKILSQLH
jgi:hypothetical protein